MESYHAPLLWTTKSLVSDVPIYQYSFTLIFDFFFYYFIAIFLGLHQHRLKEKKSLFQCNIPKSLSWNNLYNHESNTTSAHLKSTSWINLTKIGIPHLLGNSSHHYSQIPDIDFSTLFNSPINISSSVVLFISSLCKSYETTEGSFVEVLKNLNGELKKGTITTLLGRYYQYFKHFLFF